MLIVQVVLIAKVGDNPEVWRGFDHERRPLYVRYDRGHLTANLGNAGQFMAGMADTCVFTRFLEDGPRLLSYRHLKDLTGDRFHWPDFELPATDAAALRLKRLHERALNDGAQKPAVHWLDLRGYLENGRLLVPRNQPEVESLFTTTADHDCRRMGCTASAHVLLRR